jgi:SAM-dependent methyltransferase
MDSVINSYQRIVRGDKLLSPGSIDTHLKFFDMTRDIDFKGKSVIDVGCNTGEMCRLAKDAGASEVRGIDIDLGYIVQARELNPDIPFDVCDVRKARGHFDIAIASAMLHYVDNLDKTLGHLARIADTVLCDVWIKYPFDPSMEPAMLLDLDRDLMVPNRTMWFYFARKHFLQVESKGVALSPDNSHRQYFRLSFPFRDRDFPKAIIIHGDGGTGKTTLGRNYAAGQGFEHLELDSFFLTWRMFHEKTTNFSIMDCVRELWDGGGKTDERLQRYLAVHREELFKWLACRIDHDVVIEGYDATESRYREMVRDVLNDLGWTQIIEQELTRHEL